MLSIITGGGKWVEITVPMDPLYLSVLVSAEKKFWRCVQSGEPPHPINAEPPRPRIVIPQRGKEAERADGRVLQHVLRVDVVFRQPSRVIERRVQMRRDHRVEVPRGHLCRAYKHRPRGQRVYSPE